MKHTYTEEQKELLLKDLCSRLPHGVKIAMPGLWNREITVEPLNEIFKGDDDLFRVNGNGHCIEYIKPYLFPLSSMTDEQKQYLKNRFCYDWDGEPYELWKYQIEIGDADELIDWFHKNHLDYRGLIPMGLAEDATGLNIY